MTTPSPTERGKLLTEFTKALGARDMDAAYQIAASDFVWHLPIGPEAPSARTLRTRDDLADYLDERKRLYATLKYSEIQVYHAPEASFCTFRVEGTRRDDGQAFDVHGLERYLFRDGMIVQKDAYWKRIEIE